MSFFDNPVVSWVNRITSSPVHRAVLTGDSESSLTFGERDKEMDFFHNEDSISGFYIMSRPLRPEHGDLPVWISLPDTLNCCHRVRIARHDCLFPTEAVDQVELKSFVHYRIILPALYIMSSRWPKITGAEVIVQLNITVATAESDFSNPPATVTIPRVSV